jgi:hypothetical protein
LSPLEQILQPENARKLSERFFQNPLAAWKLPKVVYLMVQPLGSYAFVHCRMNVQEIEKSIGIVPHSLLD